MVTCIALGLLAQQHNDIKHRVGWDGMGWDRMSGRIGSRCPGKATQHWGSWGATEQGYKEIREPAEPPGSWRWPQAGCHEAPDITWQGSSALLDGEADPAQGLTIIFQLVRAGGQFTILALLLVLLFTSALHLACVCFSCPHRGHVHHHGSMSWGWKVSLPRQHPLPSSVPSQVDMVSLMKVDGCWAPLASVALIA